MRTAKAFAIAGLLATITLPGVALEPKSSCQALETWASQLQRLPTDYESFSQLTLMERKAVYGRLSSSERAALWQRHWQEAAVAGSWTAEQKILIEAAGQLMSADTFAALGAGQGELYDSARAAVRAFEARVQTAFPEAEATALFYRLGTPNAGKEAARVFRCYCSVGAQDCDPGLRCEPGGCQIRFTGCGMFYEEVCDGQCRYI